MRLLERLFNYTTNFSKTNNNVMFTKADKGNTTVAMNVLEYKDKMNILLSDEQTYALIEKDPINKITSNLKVLLKRWKTKGFIEEFVYKRLLTTDGLLSRAYGLPKIHKNGCPLRIIVSSIDSPLHSLSNFLHKILINAVEVPSSHIKNSFELVNKLSNTTLKPNYTVISLDVVSLFTNIPMQLAVNSILKRWDRISNSTKITQEEFVNGIKLIINSTFFTFDNRVYKQIFGTPMGSPLSPIIADLVMRDLETEALNKLNFETQIYFRYVDDILLAIPNDQIENTVNVFNLLYPESTT